MSRQLSECPNCQRTFIGAASPAGPGRCRSCGTPLILASGAEKEAEVRERLYGPKVSLATVTRVVTRPG